MFGGLLFSQIAPGDLHIKSLRSVFAWHALHWLLYCSISPLLVILIQVLRLSSQSTLTNKGIILHEDPKNLQDT